MCDLYVRRRAPPRETSIVRLVTNLGRQPFAGTPRFERLFRRLTILAALGASVLAVGLWVADVFQDAEFTTVDARFQIRGDTTPPPELVVIAIDDVTFQELDLLWPFPRRLHAELIERIARDDPAAIVYDIQFIKETTPVEDNMLIDAVAAAGSVVLATTEVAEDGSTNIFGGFPLADLGARAGSALFAPDPGGVIRRLPYEVETLPTLAVAAAETATGEAVLGVPGTSEWIDFHGCPGSVPAILFSRAQAQPEGFYRNRIVVVGATVPTLKDIHTTSTTSSDFMSGPELEAHAISTVLGGFSLQSSSGAVDIALIVVMGLIPGLLAQRFTVRWLVAISAGTGIVYLLAAQLAFNLGLVLPILYPLVALALSTIGAVAVAAAMFSLAREHARNLFARFVPRDVVDDVLARTDDDLRLGGEELDGTAMFVDLRSFTPFVDAHSADDVIAVLNRYLEIVSRGVHLHGGTVVALQGDGVMAVFGAPLPQADHADRAVACAQGLVLEGLPAFNRWVSAQGIAEQFDVGIGLASGTLRSGNVGSPDRVEYTAIGDATNTAARLQSRARDAGVAALIAASVLAQLTRPAPDLIDAGLHSLPGKDQPVRAHTFASQEARGASLPASTLAE